MADRIDDRPSVLLLEDAHWADPTTIEVVGRLQGSSRPLLLLLTTRRERDANLPDHDVRIELRGLGQHELEAVVDSLSANFPIPFDTVRAWSAGRAVFRSSSRS